MSLHELYVLHAPKRADSSVAIPELPCAFSLDTCQRSLRVTTRSVMTRTAATAERPLIRNPNLEIYQGEEAYFFLLSVATGLSSAIVGETDVFGQFKLAWKAFGDSGSASSVSMKRELSSLMQKLFEDTKEIRALYLENLGGASYGSLVRRLLGATQGDRVLLLGAGQIAQSVAPYIKPFDLVVWNRSASDLATIHGLDNESKAWRRVTHVVVGIPLDPDADARRVELWKSEPRRGRIVHLGCMRGQAPGTWEKVDEFLSLDDLYAVKDSQDVIRDSRITRARKACRERARLRALGGSLTIAHGWEDLAMFV